MAKVEVIFFSLAVICASVGMLLMMNPIPNDAPDDEVNSITIRSEVAESEEISMIEPEPELVAAKYTEDELYCMAAAIYNEAGSDSCSDDTRRLVGYVILNRVNHSAYPDTIREVLEQPSQYGTFSRTGVKFAERHSLPQEQHAVDRAYKIAKEVLEMEDIPIPNTVVFQAEFKQGTSTYKYQDGMYFCYAGGEVK